MKKDEMKKLSEVYNVVGGDGNVLFDKKISSLVINGNRVLSKNEVHGIHIHHKELSDGVKVIIVVDENVKIDGPVHLCFGMLPKNGKQMIKSEFIVGNNSSVNFVAHCFFPNAKKIVHLMDSKVLVGENAEMTYRETHYHSESGGTRVHPKIRGVIKKGGRLFEEFRLTEGRVGELKIDYEVVQEEKSSCELLAKVYGKKGDKIDVSEIINLNGKYASGTAKTRIVLVNGAKGNVTGEVNGNAPLVRGHIDCHEIVEGKGSKAMSMPKISVKDPTARVTHEAAIGRINKKVLETLMSRGLSEEEAIDFVVNGILK
ncbi:MAG: SufD family Fe-S cluster assembly protein [Candidatus Aenigmarchaeota archaeon]|nr:SufD family Fe-S cluster assembly protein [Candidatus Aenigmarchaeota archaeon]